MIATAEVKMTETIDRLKHAELFIACLLDHLQLGCLALAWPDATRGVVPGAEACLKTASIGNARDHDERRNHENNHPIEAH
jgi:hypothetical protein